jgi:hypothetical protein
LDFKEYLDQSSRIYIEAVTSDLDPVLLRRLGGVLYIAGGTADEVRTEKSAYLGFIDRDRDWRERRRLGAASWRNIRSQIENDVAHGIPPRQAVEDAFRRFGTSPHTPDQIERMGERVMGPAGEAPSWRYDILDRQYRFARSSEVMSSPIGATAAVVTLVATAENWEKATPEEWDRALAVGKIGAAAEGVAGAFAAVRQGQDANRALSQQHARGPEVVVRLPPAESSGRHAPHRRKQAAQPEARHAGSILRLTETSRMPFERKVPPTTPATWRRAGFPLTAAAHLPARGNSRSTSSPTGCRPPSARTPARSLESSTRIS